MSEEGTYGLFDFDLWMYDVGFAAEYKDDNGNLVVRDWEYCRELIDTRMAEIVEKLHLTGYEGYTTGPGNFRYDVAVTQPYKGQRKDKRKPFHLKNIEAYLESEYNAKRIDGMEADDMLAIRQTELGNASIIISRDKDLRQVEGWHYGYEVGMQGEYGPCYTDKLGSLHLKSVKKLEGMGMMFFAAQMLMGDSTDNIPGLFRYGPKKAHDLLCNCQTEYELLRVVCRHYRKMKGDDWREYFKEQHALLWMLREMPDGS